MGVIVVTGAFGNVGKSVVDALLVRGARVRVAGRNLAAVRETFGDRVESAHLDLTDPATFGPAVCDAEKVFLIRPPAIARVRKTINPFIDVAARSGVTHVVFPSVAGADTNKVVPHHRIETHLRASTMAWTMLRPGFFAQNIGGAYRSDIVDDNRIYVP